MPVIHNIEEDSGVSKQAVDFFKKWEGGGQFGESRHVHELSTVYCKKLFLTFVGASPKEQFSHGMFFIYTF